MPTYDKQPVRTAGPRTASLAGRQFGRLTVIECAGTIPHGHSTLTIWRCACQCTGEKIVRRDNLISGYTRSCGCMRTGRTHRIDVAIEEHW